ncbi:unnamed protein product [Ectocarpus fasciculatus]
MENRKAGTTVHGKMTKKWYFFKGKPSTAEGVEHLRIFGGSVYPELSQDVCKLLGITEGKINLGRYADGECSVTIGETVVGKDVFIVSPTHSNDSLVEMLLTIAAARRSSAERITAVIPFYGYSRQDRRFRREPIAAADVAHMLEAAGVDRVITIDLHSGQVQGFFKPTTPVDHLTPMGVAAAYLGELVTEELKAMAIEDGEGKGGAFETGGAVAKRLSQARPEEPTRIVVVAPQEGQVGRANAFKSRIEQYVETTPVGLAFIARSSTKKEDEEEEVHKHCIGDVKGALCIIVDDMVDTGGTLDNAVRLLKGAGARKILAFATHGRFSGGGEARCAEIPGLDCLVICNTLPHRTETGEIKDRSSCTKIRELSVAPLLAEAIYRVHKAMPFAELLTWNNPTSKGLPPRTLTRANLNDPSFAKGDGARWPGGEPR